MKMADTSNAVGDHLHRLTALVDNLPGMVYRSRCQNNKFNKTYISKGSVDLLGYAPETLVNSRDVEFDELIHVEDRERVWSVVHDAIRQKNSFEVTYRICHKHCGIRWVWERGHVRYHDDGTVDEIEGFITDITGRKKIENDLAYQKILHRSILDSLVESVVVIDQQGIIQIVNKSWFGFAKENDASDAVAEGVGINYLAICEQAMVRGEVIAGEVREGILSVLNGKAGEFTYEYPCHSPAKNRWFRMHVARFASGIPGAVISHFDITNLRFVQHQSEELNRELEQRVNERTIELGYINLNLSDEVERHKKTEAELQQFRSALDSSSDSIYLIDPRNMMFVDANRTAWQVLGYSRDELLSLGPEAIKPESVIQTLRNKIDQVLTGKIKEAVIDTTHRCRDGRLIPVDMRIKMVEASGGNKLLVAVARDITEKKRSEKILQASEQRFRLLFDNLPLGMALADEDGRYVVVNHAMCEMLGYEAEELTSGMGFQDVTHSDDLMMNAHLFRRIHETGSSGFTIEKRYIRKTHEVIWVNLIVKTIHEPGGRSTSLGIHQNITDKKRSDLVLLESRETLRALLDAAEDDYFMLLDKDGHVVQLNQSVAMSVGVEVDSVIGKSIFDYFPKDVADKRKAWLKLACEQKSPVSFEDQRDGRFFHTKLYPILDHQQELIRVAAFARDVTDIKMASERRLMQEREHRETLVREVHHRIKNNLQSVSGLLRRQVRLNPGVNEILQAAISQVDVVAIVHGIQGAAGEGHLYLCDMVPNIARTAIELDRVDVSYDFTNQLPDLVAIVADEAVPVALILNELITNALKHGNDADRILTICLKRECYKVEIRIENHGVLPELFDFENGMGLGTGLKLVRSLMPEKGVEIIFSYINDEVVTRLLLDEPVVTYDPRSCTRQ